MKWASGFTCLQSLDERAVGSFFLCGENREATCESVPEECSGVFNFKLDDEKDCDLPICFCSYSYFKTKSIQEQTGIAYTPNCWHL